MKISQPIVQAVAGVLLVSAAQAGAASEQGKALAWKYHCTTCHGQQGVSNTQRYPNLAGQNVAYLESRLRYFREGVEHGNQMNGQAAPLSDEEITLISKFFNNPSQGGTN
ncbi:MAG: c-type cytochrome [bacterium]